MWRQRLLYWTPRLSLGIGILALAAGAVFTVLTARFVAGSERAEGTVVDRVRSVDEEDDSVSFYPVVRFTTAAGRTVRFESNVSTSDEIGDEVEVLYDPDDPTDARLSGFLNVWGFSLIFAGIGAVFITVSAVILRRTRRPSKEDVEGLRRHGRRVQGGSPRVVYCTEIDVAGSSPYRLEVDVHDRPTNKVRVLKSEYIWFDPEPYLKGRETIDVYLDPEDPDRYVVDTSFLPESEDESVRLAP
jgi:hypothetical protein